MRSRDPRLPALLALCAALTTAPAVFAAGGDAVVLLPFENVSGVESAVRDGRMSPSRSYFRSVCGWRPSRRAAMLMK